jgi:hypothetical protein
MQKEHIMTTRDLVAQTIRDCRLTIGAEELHTIAAPVLASISELTQGQTNAILLLLERLILPKQGGHRMTVKFGHSDAMNNPVCLICRRPVDESDWSLRMLSRWEQSQYWITLHDYCIENAECKIEFDILTGNPTSPVGYI